MLNLNTRRSTYIANTLVAIVLTLIVNFSYIISMIVDEREREREMYRQEREVERERYKPQFEGTLHISPDGYGYLIAEGGDGFIKPPGWEEHEHNNDHDRDRDNDRDNNRDRDRDRDNNRDNDQQELRWYRTDSVFVNQAAIFIYNLQDGDQILGTLNRPRGEANPSLDRPLRKNGEDIAPVVYDRPNRNNEFVIQLLFYFGISLIALTIMTFRFDANNFTMRRYSLRCAITLLVIACCYMFTPVVDWGPRSSEITMIMNLDRDNLLDWMAIYKYLVVIIVTLLYGRIYGMLLKQQQIQIENEHLRT